MKKSKVLSLMLVFTLVLSTFSLSTPAMAAEEASPQEELFEILVTKFSSIRNPEDAAKALQVILTVDNEETLLSNIEEAINENEAAKQILLNNGLNRDSIARIVTEIKEQYSTIGEIILDSFIDDSTPTYSEYSTQIKEMVLSIYDVVPQEVKDDLGRYGSDRDEKIDFLLQFVNKFIESKVGIAVYDATAQKYTSINLQTPENFLEEANELLANPLEGEGIELTAAHINSINAIVDVIEMQIEDADNGSETGILNDAAYLLVKAGLVTKNIVNEPGPGPDPGDGGDTGSGGGGGGGGSADDETPEIEEPTIPSNPEEAVTIEVGKDSITVEEVDGTTNVTVNEEAAIAAVEAVAKAAEEGRSAEIVLPVSETKDTNLNVSLPSALVTSLAENNVDLVIRSNNIEYNVPADVLSDIDIPDGATVEFKSTEVKAEDVKELSESLTSENNVAKVIELTMEIKADGETTQVTKFKTYIVVKLDITGLGNADKLVVYYVNEETGELELVSAKVVDGKILIRTNHYSKYAVVERNISFTDVQSHWAKEYIESMAAKQIIDGNGDGTYAPNSNVTRAQFAKMIVNALELDIVKYNGEFSDVASEVWYADYVATAQAAGLVTGYGDGIFQPNKEISRLEMAVMLSRALSDIKVKDVEVYTNLAQFTDSEVIGTWARTDVAKTIKAGLMNGVSDSEFAPTGTTTRAHAATTIYRLFNR